MDKPLTPEQAAKLERQRRAAEDGSKAMQEAAARAVAVRENMARLRQLRLTKEAQEVRTKVAEPSPATNKPKKRLR